jgi:hypothetical protein
MPACSKAPAAPQEHVMATHNSTSGAGFETVIEAHLLANG